MKTIIVIGDGMSDRPIASLGGKTPIQAAKTPFMDNFATMSEIGLMKTIPDGLPAGSDTANLSIMGYDPRLCYTGRSPLEAVSLGIPMQDADIAFRCNLVTLSDADCFENRKMLSHSGSQISHEEAIPLMEAIQQQLGSALCSFYVGTAYRHLMIYHGADIQPQEIVLSQPHDIPGQVIAPHLPQGKNASFFSDLIQKSMDILCNHPVNIARQEKGLLPANALWFWGQGKKPNLTSLTNAYGISGSMISAVPLLHGIGILAGLKSVHVEGATADIHTNYEGKVSAALLALKQGNDFVFLHIEAPDECGHDGNINEKILSIEYLDQRVLAPLKKGLDDLNEPYRLLIMPDHATPVELRTHAADPVPYCLYQSNQVKHNPNRRYDEANALDSGIFLEDGHTMMARLLSPQEVI